MSHDTNARDRAVAEMLVRHMCAPERLVADIHAALATARAEERVACAADVMAITLRVAAAALRARGEG